MKAGLVDVAFGAVAVEGCGLGLVEGGVSGEANGEVGVGDEELAEGDGVGFTVGEDLVGGFEGELLVGDVDAAELTLQIRAKPATGAVFAGHEEGQFAAPEFTGDVAEGFGKVAVGDAVGVGTGGEVHADAAGAPDADGGVGDFEHEPGAVFDGAAELIGAVVGAGLKELVEEIAVGAVDLDAIEAGTLRVFGGAAELLDDEGNLAGFESAWGDEGFLWTDEGDVAGGSDGAGRDGEFAMEESGVGDAADVPDLLEDAAAVGVNCGGDGLPGLDLLLGPDAGDLSVANAHGGDGGAFGDDEAGGGALGVVLRHDWRGDVIRSAPEAGKRGHDDAAGEREIAYFDGVEESWHGDEVSLDLALLAWVG